MFIDIIKKFNDVTLKQLQSTVIKEPLKEAQPFIDESRKALQYTPCNEYIELLKLTNGFEWNGLFIDSTKDFVESNLDLRDIRDDYNNNFIIFGLGSLEACVFNIKSNDYCIVNAVDFDEDIKSFETFGEMFIAALSEVDSEYYKQVIQ